jgi:pyrroloquinoline quinone (PQQ) biosynthesis protein C
MKISHSRRLRQKIELLLPEMAAVSAELADHPHFRALYPELLVNMHQGMRASAALLRTAAARCRELAGTDPVAAALAPYYAHHVQEEDHAHWALEDLEVLGVPRAEVLRRMPSPAVASMVGAQYYWVLHHHFLAMLGDMMVREGYPASIEAVEVLVARSGYPRTAFRTLERHAHLDQHHRDDLIELLDGLPLQEEHHTILGVSALHTVDMVIQANRELLERARQPEHLIQA